MKYAIGEIVLVVIGILIALSINNWNENRKERQIEIKYLSNLKRDLQNDSIDLNRVKKIRLNKVISAKKLLNYAESKELNTIYKIDSLYVDVAYWLEYVPNNNSFKEIISSGNLNIIKNETIKSLLLELSNKNEEIVSDRDHMRREYENYLYDKRTESINLFDVNNPSDNITADDWFYPNKEVTEANAKNLRQGYRTLFKNKTFITGLAYAAGNNLYMVNQYNLMLAQIYILIEIIEKELN
ncbi:MAG: hypothetical protein HKO81_01215 [Flavobacteriaceae bacterium]|nr:hypothetical protein [Flavobacteriaceae bacterium]